MFYFDEFCLEPEVFKNPLMKWQISAFRILGHIVSSEDKFKCFHLLRGPIIVGSLIYLIVAQAISVWINRNDINKVVVPLAALIVFVNIATRMLNFYPHHKRYIKLINSVNDGVRKVFETNNEYELNVYKDYIKVISRISSTLFFPLMIAAIFMISDASYFLIFSYDKFLEFQNTNSSLTLPRIYELYPFHLFTNNFILAFIVPFYMVTVGIFAFFTWHTFNTSLMRYASFRLDVINYKLLNMNEYTNLHLMNLNLVANSTAYCRDTVRRAVFLSCIEDITDIRSFTDNLTKITSGALFVESVTISGLLCLLMYQTSRDSISGIGIYLFWGMGMVGILYIYYWHGNEISEKSDKLTTSLYCSPWHEFPVTLQKDILIFMKISWRPIIMKAVLFYMNNAALLLILKTTYSYFTLLQNVAN